MMVAFAVWFAFRIMRHVSSFTEESPAEVWTEVMFLPAFHLVNAGHFDHRRHLGFELADFPDL